MRVRSIAGDTVGVLLFRHLGRDDDEIEKEFYRLNSGIAKHGPVLPSGVVVELPTVVEQPAEKVVAIWD